MGVEVVPEEREDGDGCIFGQMAIRHQIGPGLFHQEQTIDPPRIQHILRAQRGAGQFVGGKGPDGVTVLLRQGDRTVKQAE